MKPQPTDKELLAAIGQSIPRQQSRGLRACLVECADRESSGSIGAEYVRRRAEKAGASIEVLPLNSPKTGYDVEMVSVHHCTDISSLAALPKRGKVRLVGGHVTLSNPRPLIPFADAICVGEGESWVYEGVKLLSQDLRPESLEALPGTILPSRFSSGDPLPPANHERPLPDNAPYLNRPGTLRARWYIEIARGCPFQCAYCEVGHSMPYRFYPLERILELMTMIDGKTTKINFFAPDEASHPNYPQLMEAIRDRGYRQGYGSYRADRILKRGLELDIGREQLIRVGVDGLTEETRKRVGKPITNEMLLELFRRFSRQDHIQFKMFMMFGYPWEEFVDFDEWEDLMGKILAIPGRGYRWLRIKWTPLIPQPPTPLGKEKAPYRFDIAERIKRWHETKAVAASKLRHWRIDNDGLMSAKSHAEQVRLTQGNEFTALRGAKGWVHPTWRKP